MQTKVKLNVFGIEMETCCESPLTGFFRDGFCRTDEEDQGRHIVCAEMTEEFLNFSKSKGNDLTAPWPEAGFLGLKPGDRWCLCVLRWKEALEAGVAPRVFLQSCDQSALKYVSMQDLKKHAFDLA